MNQTLQIHYLIQTFLSIFLLIALVPPYHFHSISHPDAANNHVSETFLIALHSLRSTVKTVNTVIHVAAKGVFFSENGSEEL